MLRTMTVAAALAAALNASHDVAPPRQRGPTAVEHGGAAVLLNRPQVDPPAVPPVSTTGDATGSYFRYDYHLGSNFFDYPKVAVWPDAYYMSMNVFNSTGTAFLGPQPFAFDRSKMLVGLPGTFVSTGITGGSSEESYLPADLDGSLPPLVGAPATFVEWPGGGSYRTFHFHVDFVTPSNSTFTLFGSPAAAGFTVLCSTTRSCVPQAGTTSRLDGIGKLPRSL